MNRNGVKRNYDSDRRNVDRREQGYNEVELCNTRHADKRSKENALSAEQQSWAPYQRHVDAFIPRRSPQTPSYPRQPFLTAQGDSSDQLQGEDRRAHYVSQQGMSSFVPGTYYNEAPNFVMPQTY